MPNWRQTLGPILTATSVVAAALLVIFLGTVGDVQQDVRTRAVLKIHAGLGFRLANAAPRSPGVHDPPASMRPVITEVTPGKPMAAAGLRAGDRIGYHYAGCVYAELVRGQGHAIALPVQRDSERLTLTVQVPELRLSDDPAQIHWACPHPAGHLAEPAPRAPKWVDGR